MTETERNQIKCALLKCAKENENKFTLTGHIVVSSLCRSAVERIEELEKENAELKEKISVLLSCKNCSENKGGWICVKEYENKCLAQKIEYIKELKKENAQLKKQQFSLRNERNTFLAQNEQYEKDLINFNENLTKAKELLRKFLDAKSIEETCVAESEAEQFISEVEK